MWQRSSQNCVREWCCRAWQEESSERAERDRRYAQAVWREVMASPRHRLLHRLAKERCGRAVAAQGDLVRGDGETDAGWIDLLEGACSNGAFQGDGHVTAL
jgi:hypothetical protein